MVGLKQKTSTSHESQGVLKLMCQIWNETHVRHHNAFLPHLDSNFDLKQSMTWDEMKELLDSEHQDSDGDKGQFETSAGKAAYAAVSSTMLHVVTREELTEEETAEVMEHIKTEKEISLQEIRIAEGTRLKLPLDLVERLTSKVNLERYPSGYDKDTRALILESVTVFNLNDVHPAFYRFGHRLANITEEEDLKQFLERVRHDRFEHLIQAIANEEGIAETEFSPEMAESFLSEEEKEILREWRADIASVHKIDSAFSKTQHEFMDRYGIMDA